MKDDGGSIYAGLKTSVPMGGDVSQVTRMEPEGGLSVRDWFAGEAAASIVGGSVAAGVSTGPEAGIEIARAAYQLADAMIQVRKENQ